MEQPRPRRGVKTSPTAFRSFGRDIGLRRSTSVVLYRAILDNDHALRLLSVDDDGLREPLLNAGSRLSISRGEARQRERQTN